MVRQSAIHDPIPFEELKKLFDVVAQGKQMWEATFDAIVDPVLVVRGDYTVDRANMAAAGSAGVEVKKLIGKKCFQIFAKRKSPCIGCPLQVSIQANSPRRSELEAFSDQREFLASAYPIKARQGEADGWVAVQYHDLSLIRKLEGQIQQNEKMISLGRLASGIAHDVNNPLSGVLAFTQLAMQEADPNSQIFGDLKEIEQAALRCKKIVEDVLQFTRPSPHNERNWVNLEEMIRRMLPSIEILWKEFPYQLSLDFQKISSVKICESRFEQVFANILTNAFQSLSAGGEVKVRSGEKNGTVFIEVEDSGEGISKENLKRIFDPYFTTRRDQGGTGLGLPICYQIVREHGGRIEVTSVLKKGSVFRISIPKGESYETSNSRRG